MQRFTGIALVVAALIVAAALIDHGRQLAALEKRLEAFTTELPSMVEQAGKGAGEQAVHGILEEAFLKPLRQASSGFAQATSHVQTNAGSRLDVMKNVPDGGIPLIRFDIPDPVVNIEIHAHVTDLPFVPRLSPTNQEHSVAWTHLNVNTQRAPLAVEYEWSP